MAAPQLRKPAVQRRGELDGKGGRGGAQFTYYFWLYLGDASAENVRNRVIMLRGDPKAYSYTKTSRQTDSVLNMPDKVEKITGRPVTKCPAIGFGPTFDTFVVSFNTLDDPDETIVIKPNNTIVDVSSRHNVLKLIRNKWALLSFVFEDNVAITDFEDGIIMRFYVNDVLYQVDKRRSTLRQNAGDLVLFPQTPNVGDGGLKGSRIADLTYRNYAMSANSVREVYDAGPPKYFASELAGHNEVGDPLYLSVYNKLDIYNT